MPDFFEVVLRKVEALQFLMTRWVEELRCSSTSRASGGASIQAGRAGCSAEMLAVVALGVGLAAARVAAMLSGRHYDILLDLDQFALAATLQPCPHGFAIYSNTSANRCGGRGRGLLLAALH